MKELKYHKPYRTFGRPLTPEILEAIGIITGYSVPVTKAASSRMEFDLWSSTTRKGLNYHQGALRLEITNYGGTRVLRVEETRRGGTPGEQREHDIVATIRCGRDRWLSPMAWDYLSWMRGADGRLEKQASLAERVRRDRRKLKGTRQYRRFEETLPGKGRLVSAWGLYETVRHLPRKKGFTADFDCLEHLRKLKPGHRLAYQRSQVHQLAGREVRLHVFVQWGWGILPTEYWVDDHNRLLLVIDANRVAVARALRPNEKPVPAGRPPKLVQSAGASNVPVRRTARPNILFLCTDQQHHRAWGAAGNRHVRTPAMDAMAASGTVFTEAYCTYPLCSPSRSSLFTGRMPSETGITRLSNGEDQIRAGLPNLGEWFSEQGGYDCYYAGKWHVTTCHDYKIPGFHVLGTGQDHRGDISDVTVAHACEGFLLGQRRRDPFLLVASITQPHDVCDWVRLNLLSKKVPGVPLSVAEMPPLPRNFKPVRREPEYIRRYRQQQCEPILGHWTNAEWRWYLWNYYRMVEMADAEIGRILYALHASGQAENTLVVFTSDHGEGLGEHQLDRKNFHYESAVRVPLAMSWPGHIPAGRVDRCTLASGIDLLPTMAGLAGIDAPRLTTACDLSPALAGDKLTEREGVAVEMSARVVGRVWRTLRYKYVVVADDPVEQLFDLKKDPGETQNLARRAAYRAVLVEHRAGLARWERSLDSAPGEPSAGRFQEVRT